MAEKLEFVIGAKEKFTGVFGKLNVSLKRLTKVAAGAGVAVAGVSTALFVMTKNVAKTSDEIGKFAGRIGVSVDALSKYQHVAELSGISTAALNVGWQRMTRRIAEASQGVGVAVGALQELQIPLDSIVDLAPDKQFEMIAGALSNVANQGDKVRLAMQFWDTEGVSLLQTIQDGTEGLEEMKKEAESLGIVLTEQGVKRAAEFNDSLTRLQGSTQGLKLSLSNELMPVFTSAFNNLSTIVSSNRDKIVKTVKDISVKIAEQAATLLIGTAQLADTIAPVIRSIKNRLVEIFDTFSGLPSWVLEIGLVGAILVGKKGAVAIAGLALLVSSINELWTSGEIVKKRIGSLNEQLETLKERLEHVRDGGDIFSQIGADLLGGDLETNLENQIIKIEAMRDALLETSNVIGTSKDSETSLGDILNTDDANTQSENLGTLETAAREFIENIRALFAEGDEEEGLKFNFFDEEETEATIENISAIQEKLVEWKESMTEIQDSVAGLIINSFNMVSEGIGRAVADTIFEGENLGKALANLMKQVAKNIIATLIQIRVERLILYVLNMATGLKESTARMAQLSAQTYAGAFAATAAIPIIGPALAPGVAAASTAAMLVGSTAAGTTGAGVGAAIGIAHGGLTNVPSESTFLLDRGERVLSPNQNRDLTTFLKKEKTEISITNNQKTILEKLSETVSSFVTKNQISEPSLVVNIAQQPVLSPANTLNNEDILENDTSNNRSLTKIIVENLTLSILPNATNVDAMLSMTRDDWRSIVEENILPAFSTLQDEGVTV